MTTHPALARVLSTVVGQTPETWLAAVPDLARERDAVLRRVADDSQPAVYGFSTLLGQLDGVTGSSGRELWEAHLVGPRHTLPGRTVSLISACKAEQLSHGGSGIDPDAYRAVVASASNPGKDADGCWSTSSGSGDVVPGAWWVSALGTQVDPDRVGETIALINGTFVSTAAAVLAAARLAASGERVIAALRAARAAPLNQLEGGRQRPVSLRDNAPIEHGLRLAIEGLVDAIERRLGAPSANPWFSFDGDEASAHSGSQFLDYGATWALTSATQSVFLGLAVVQRVAEHHSVSVLTQGPEPRVVQPPKILQAIIERAHFEAGTLPVRFGGTESEGIEDLRDLSLLTAVRLLRLLDRLDEALDVLDAMVPPAVAPHPELSAIVSSEPGVVRAAAELRWGTAPTE